MNPTKVLAIVSLVGLLVASTTLAQDPPGKENKDKKDVIDGVKWLGKKLGIKKKKPGGIRGQVDAEIEEAKREGYSAPPPPPPREPLESKELAFNPGTDTLCFDNFDPALGENGLLGKWGQKKGVCQGMVGIVSSFYKNAEYAPEQPRSSEAEAEEIIAKMIQASRRSQPGRIQVPGYANLRSFCADYRNHFVRASIDNNAKIAVCEIVPNLEDFLWMKSSPLSDASGRYQARLRRTLADTIASFQKKLAQGFPPLILRYSHVTMVRAIDVEKNESGAVQAVSIRWFDPNDWQEKIMRVDYDADGLPSLASTMFWDVTPAKERYSLFCY